MTDKTERGYLIQKVAFMVSDHQAIPHCQCASVDDPRDTCSWCLDVATAIVDGIALDLWREGYSTCLGDFDIAARAEARSPSPYEVTA